MASPPLTFSEAGAPSNSSGAIKAGVPACPLAVLTKVRSLNLAIPKSHTLARPLPSSSTFCGKANQRCSDRLGDSLLFTS